MAKALICDRCGKVYPPRIRRTYITVISTPTCSTSKHLDLCPECEKEALAFFKLAKPDNQES